jgi:beta-glucanase (GH16 family)
LYGFLGGGAGVAQGQTLSLVWSDEFNGASIDLTKWTFDTGHGGSNPGWGNDELEYYTSRTNNAYVTNGMLHIRAQIETTNSSEGTFYYTSARMKTQGLYWKTYGRIEWRAKLPAGVGFWPALWSLGTNINAIGWPGCGEIDVVENNGATITFEQGSIHSGSDATQVYNFTGGDSVTNFHVYDLDWNTNATGGVSITWSVDGVAYETQTSWSSSTGNPYPYPFNQPFFFLMNLAVGGDYLGNPSTNSINPNMPGEIVVDYMRVYDYVTIVPTNPPATPTGLTATPGGTSVALNWNAASGAANYNVKRSLVSGGSYTTIATLSATNYTDTGLATCATYYYVVSATNSVGESTNSTQAAATLGPYYFAVGSGDTSPAGTFVADTDFTGGIQAAPSTATINTSNVTNPAPQAVYQHERYNNFFYTFSGLTTGLTYTVRLHECEIYWTAAGKREFNVFINGVEVLTNFDIFAAAGGENIAVVKQYSVKPMANGVISVAYSNGAVDDAKSSGIEIILPAPAAPVGVTATGEVGQVVLTWSPVSGVTGYDIGRSTTEGGPYTNVASGVIGTAYTDANVTNGTTYYYVVSSLNGNCTGANSSEVNATPTAPNTPFQQWQAFYFGNSGNGAPNFDPYGKGISNTNQFLLGLNPTNPASTFTIIAVSQSGGTNTVTWKTSGGDVNAALFGGPTVITNFVQGAVGTPDGEYSNNFSAISGPMIITPAGDTVTNFSDTSGTNLYYRITAP